MATHALLPKNRGVSIDLKGGGSTLSVPQLIDILDETARKLGAELEDFVLKCPADGVLNLVLWNWHDDDGVTE